MNRLTRLKIKGYKSLNDVDLRFEDRTILIGQNGAGKSNLFAAFRMLEAIG